MYYNGVGRPSSVNVRFYADRGDDLPGLLACARLDQPYIVFGTGKASFTAFLTVPSGQSIISATATDASNNTSEFSQTAKVTLVTIPNNYTGLDFNHSQGYIPPDSCGAAGPSNYVETVNQEIAIYSPKATGANKITDSLSHFLFTVGHLTRADSSSGLSDPIVTYDELAAGLESSVQGLHFLGAPAAWSFGPLMRFVSGTGYTARALTRCVVRNEKQHVYSGESVWQPANLRRDG